VAAAVVALPGCKKEEDRKNEVRRAIDRTVALSRQFAYLDQEGDDRIQVVGLVEDDFRHKARLTVNGAPIVEEVASDDALAMRFLDPGALATFLSERATVATTATPATPAPRGIGVLDALRTRRWVLDPEGAPDLKGTAGDARVQGQDPVFDALTAMEYVRRSVDAAIQVKLYSRDDYAPVWRAREDPFPQPPQESKTKRYDLRAPPLPPPGAGGGNQDVPSLANFRKMVIYVRDGRVVQVLERIDLASKLGEVIVNLNLPDDTTALQAANAINAVRRGQGADLIRLRNMRLEFSDLGGDLSVSLPGDVVNGSLSVIKFRGRTVVGATTPPTTAAAPPP
jgi:hypothetical protein